MKFFPLALALFGATGTTFVHAEETLLEEECIASVLSGKSRKAPHGSLRRKLNLNPIEPDFELSCKTPSGMFYKVDVPDRWIKSKLLSGELESENTHLAISRGTRIVDDVLQIPRGAKPKLENQHHKTKEQHKKKKKTVHASRKLIASGDKTALAVRVRTTNGVHSASLDTLSNDIFGTNGAPVTLSSQYDDCSHGQFTVGPADARTGETVNIENGVVEIAIDIRTGSESDGCAPRDALTNRISAKLNEEFGVNSPSELADFILYCMPPGAMSGGCGETPGWLTWYDDGRCEDITFTVHEIGHNLGMGHASEGGDTYGDNTDMMGGPLGDQQVCFNGAKAWRLGWFSSRQLTINSSSNTEYQGTLGSVVENPNSGSHPIIIKLDRAGSEDYYVTFNAVTGPTRGVDEGINEVTVVRQDTQGGDAFTSYLVAKLGVGSSYRISNFGNGEDLTITVNSRATLTAEVSICLGGCSGGGGSGGGGGGGGGGDTCQSHPTWVDSYDDDCAEYDENPDWCAEYGDDVGTDGLTANHVCCVCGGSWGSGGGGGPSPTPPAPTPNPTPVPTPAPIDNGECQDVTNWEDDYGDSCADYNLPENQWWCDTYGDTKGTDNLTPVQACCVCKSGSGGGGTGPAPTPNPTPSPTPNPTPAPTPAPVLDNSGCESDPNWEDSYGDSCAEYDENPQWCPDFGDDVGTNGNTANQVCCVCGGSIENRSGSGGGDGNNGECLDMTNWVDAWNDPCSGNGSYEENPSWCIDYGGEAGAGGFTANQACCVCGGGSSGN